MDCLLHEICGENWNYMRNVLLVRLMAEKKTENKKEISLYDIYNNRKKEKIAYQSFFESKKAIFRSSKTLEIRNPHNPQFPVIYSFLN